jgi:phosphohistidine phosphatase
MKVYFVRHATASNKSGWTQDDDLRPLTRAGRKRFCSAATAMIGVGALHPDLIVTSPLVRARQTADLLAQALADKTPIVEDPRLGHQFDCVRFSAILAENAEVRALAIVGHNPSFAGVLSVVTGGLDVDVRKGSVALIEIDDITDPVGRLMWLAPPSLFALTADDDS